MRSISSAALLAGLLVGTFGSAAGGNIEVGWDAVSGASGYRVYLGTQSGNYTASIDVGPATQTSLSALADCKTYYVAVKAYNQAGESQSFSNEVTGWARPELSGVTRTVAQGEQLVLDIAGANFESGAEVRFDEAVIPDDVFGNPLILVGPVSVVSCHKAQALLTVEPSSASLQPMPLGALDLPVEVVNPDGAWRGGAIPLQVEFDRSRADTNRSNPRTNDRVDGDDLATLVKSWASGYGDSDFAWHVDLDGDTDVDGDDLALLALVFGRCRDGEAWTVKACEDRDGT